MNINVKGDLVIDDHPRWKIPVLLWVKHYEALDKRGIVLGFTVPMDERLASCALDIWSSTP